MFVGNILEKPLRDLTRPLGNTWRFKRLVAFAKCNRTSHERGFIFLFFVFHFVFSLSIAKGLAICKFGGVISAKIFIF
jgi:hypothetical protein